MPPAVNDVSIPDARTRFRLALERVGLPAWFVLIDLLWIATPITFGIDARHYQRAASAWLSGGDPWQVFEHNVPFAAGPHTLLFYAPTDLLSMPVAVAVWMMIGVAAAVWTVRRLHLPIWWFAFPPLFHAVWNGNPQTLMLAFLLLNLPVASALAAALKLYALVPLVLRPRHLVAAGALLAVTLLILPWQLYVSPAVGRPGVSPAPGTARVARARPRGADTGGVVDPAAARRRMVVSPRDLAGDAVLLRIDRLARRGRTTGPGRTGGGPRAADGAGHRHRPGDRAGRRGSAPGFRAASIATGDRGTRRHVAGVLTMSLTRLWLFLAVALPVLASLVATMSTVDLAYRAASRPRDPHDRFHPDRRHLDLHGRRPALVRSAVGGAGDPAGSRRSARGPGSRCSARPRRASSSAVSSSSPGGAASDRGRPRSSSSWRSPWPLRRWRSGRNSWAWPASRSCSCWSTVAVNDRGASGSCRWSWRSGPTSTAASSSAR